MILCQFIYMKLLTSFIFSGKNIIKTFGLVQQVFTWNCSTLNIKNWWGFIWNLNFYIKLSIRSRGLRTWTFIEITKSDSIFVVCLVSFGYFCFCKLFWSRFITYKGSSTYYVIIFLGILMPPLPQISFFGNLLAIPPPFSLKDYVIFSNYRKISTTHFSAP